MRDCFIRAAQLAVAAALGREVATSVAAKSGQISNLSLLCPDSRLAWQLVIADTHPLDPRRDAADELVANAAHVLGNFLDGQPATGMVFPPPV